MGWQTGVIPKTGKMPESFMASSRARAQASKPCIFGTWSAIRPILPRAKWEWELVWRRIRVCSESTAERADTLHCIASRLWPGEEGVEPLCHTPAARELNWMRTRPKTLTGVRQVWLTGEQGGEAAQVEYLAWLPGFTERR